MRLVVPCPAKINTFLAVGPKDKRGYHPLRTIFQAVGLFDTLTIETSSIDEITCDWDGFPAENTLTKTLRLLKEVVSLPPLRIHLEKRIPVQSGLGGGSSDAAGLLRAASRIIGSPIPPGELKSIAAAVGADVPFFLVGGRAKGEGYGQKLTPLPDRSTKWVVIAMPEGEGCSTSEMFQRLDALSYDFREFGEEDFLWNDFERVAPETSLKTLRSLWVPDDAVAGLTGSGAASFSICESEGQAHLYAGTCAVGQTWVVPTLSRAQSLAISAA